MTGVIVAGILLITILAIILLQKAVYRRYWNENLTFNSKPSKNAIFEGDTVELIDSVTNGKRLPLPWVHVSYKLAYSSILLSYVDREVIRGELRNLLFIVGINKTVRKRSKIQLNKRGYYTIKESTIACNNLFMTEFMQEDISVPFGLIVYPRYIDYPELMIPLRKMLGDVSVRRFTDPDPFTFKGVREYQPYDSFRQVNWKATAKIGELMSNVYDFTIYQEITVILDIHEYRTYDRLFVHEEAIRIAAFICRSCIKKDIPVSLICPDSDGSPLHISSGMSNVHLERIYTALAFIDLNKYCHSFSERVPASSEKSYILISSYGERREIEMITGTDIIKLEVRE
ncbi:MAG: DUF58 domain-containing protein [Oscillospiraceae bacterium]|nr:DUF58 domain-containing protein [Oscillospiraceae bacterium]